MPNRTPRKPPSTLAAASVFFAFATLGTLGTGAAGCDKGEEVRTVKPVAATERPRRSAIAFVRCVEQTGGLCVEAHRGIYGWDAFSLVGWMASGSPPGILKTLGLKLQWHSNESKIQRTFVAQMNGLREPLRGAECQPAGITPLSELIGPLRTSAETRLTNIGLWNADFQRVVEQLSNEASEELDKGYLVEMSCMGAPYSFFVATTDEDGRQVPVGMMMSLPSFLGGEPPGRDHVEGRLAQIRTIAPVQGNTVSPWIPLPLEEL